MPLESTAAARHEGTSSYFGLWLASLVPAHAAARGETRTVVSSAGYRLELQTEAASEVPDVWTSDGHAVLFEGVLYDRDRLLGELGCREADCPGDAQLVLLSYLRWGSAVVNHLRGIFTFCLWDGRSSRLVAARDRVGIFPLFYCQHEGSLHLSTTTDSLGAFTGPQLKVDRNVVAALLAGHHSDLEETFYEGVQRVPPGHMLIADAAGTRTERYWRPAPVGEGADWVREDELGRFGELLDQAVGRALDRGQPGILLSGGLDSVSVAASAVDLAASRGTKAPHALSLRFPGDVNEEELQRAVASGLGIDQTFMDLEQAVGGEGLMSAGLRLSAVSSAPLQNVWLPAYHELARAGRRRGAQVLLSGGGGDEWLTVTPLVAADLIRKLDFTELAGYLAALQRSLNLPRTSLWRNVLWSNGLRPLLSQGYQRGFTAVAPRLRRARVERALRRSRNAAPSWLAPDPNVRQSLGERSERRLLARLDRSLRPGKGGFYFNEMERSLQHPLFALDVEEIFESSRRLGMLQFDIYWDADLIEFLYRVPPRLLNAGGRSKGLVRNEIARRFPGLGFDRQKKLLSRDYFCNTLLDEGARAWQALGGVPALASLGVVEPPALEAHVRQILERRDSARVDLVWRILSLESWVRPRV